MVEPAQYANGRMASQKEYEIVDEVSKFLLDIITLSEPPQVPQSFAHAEPLQTLYTSLISLRSFLYAASNGDLSGRIPFKGYIGGTLKTLQANLKHLTWQTKMVTLGDFTQRVEFMGEFAESFNAMVMQLDQTLKELVRKESEVRKVNEDLHREIAVRERSETALRKSEEALRLLATTDSLTGLYNRGHFNKLALEEINRAIRYSRPLSAMMFDIDFFKHINDTFGHTAGDRVLKMVAKAVREMVRATDIAARYGGEEFIVLLPESPAKEAAIVAERLRKRIEETTVQIEKCPIKITASFGVSGCLEKGNGKLQERILSRLVVNADRAMYASKNAGRNRITVFEPGEESSQ
jgi:diguanylate cyclase (GGDEF)-like protein